MCEDREEKAAPPYTELGHSEGAWCPAARHAPQPGLVKIADILLENKQRLTIVLKAYTEVSRGMRVLISVLF